MTNKNFLNQYDVDMTSFNGGEFMKIRIGVENHVDELLSDTVSFLLAQVPDQPDPPTRSSDTSRLNIYMTEPAFDGESQITSYELQFKYLDEEYWTTLVGGDHQKPNLNLTYTIHGIESGM